MKKVNFVSFHQGLFIPDIGDIGRTLPSQGKTLDLKMFATPEGVTLDMSWKGKKSFVLVPWPNVVVAVLEPEPTKPAAAAVKAA